MKGKQKLFLPFDGKTIIEQVVNEVCDSAAFETIVVSSPETNSQLEELLSKKVQLAVNLDYKTGMTSSIKTGIRSCSKDSEGFMICLGDMPLLQSKEYDRLISAFSSEYDNYSQLIVVPQYEGKRGNPSIFSSTFRRQILDHDDPEGCRGIIKSHESSVIKVGVASVGTILDIDNEQAYISLTRQWENRTS